MTLPELRSRLNTLPAYERGAGEIAAVHYNRVRLAMLRLGEPLRLPLVRLRGLDMVLTSEFWACVDRTLNDVPVIGWMDFQDQSRDSLVAPVRCDIRRFHAHAERLLPILWEDMIAELDRELADAPASP